MASSETGSTRPRRCFLTNAATASSAKVPSLTAANTPKAKSRKAAISAPLIASPAGEASRSEISMAVIVLGTSTQNVHCLCKIAWTPHVDLCTCIAQCSHHQLLCQGQVRSVISLQLHKQHPARSAQKQVRPA